MTCMLHLSFTTCRLDENVCFHSSISKNQNWGFLADLMIWPSKGVPSTDVVCINWTYSQLKIKDWLDIFSHKILKQRKPTKARRRRTMQRSFCMAARISKAGEWRKECEKWVKAMWVSHCGKTCEGKGEDKSRRGRNFDHLWGSIVFLAAASPFLCHHLLIFIAVDFEVFLLGKVWRRAYCLWR